MADESAWPAPEVAALLRDLDRDPEEALLAFARTTRRRQALSARRLGNHRATEALRHAHRDQAALLLARLAQRRQHEDPFWRGVLHRSLGVGKELRLHDSAALERRRNALLESFPGEGHGGFSRQLKAVGSDRPGTSTLDIALASWSLVRNDTPAVVAAYEYVRLGRWEHAHRMLDEVVDHPFSPLNASIGWEARGVLSLHRSRPADALEAFRAAANVGDPRPTALGSWLIVAVSLGEAAQAGEAASRLERLVDSSDPAIRACVRAFLELKARRLFHARFHDHVTRDTVSRGPATSMIIHVLL